MVKQNKTAFWPNLDSQETLGSILTVKLALKWEKIHTIDIPNNILTRAKQAIGNTTKHIQVSINNCYSAICF